MSAFGGKADITVKTGPLRGVFLCLRAGYRQRALMMKFSVFAATIIATETFVASSAFAYHDILRGGSSIGVVLPIVIVVVIGMVGLGIWDRKMRKTKSKRKRKRKRG